MRVTEKEAMGKLCVKPQGGICEASDCMAWRWVESITPKEYTLRGTIFKESTQEPLSEREKYEVPDSWIFVPYTYGKISKWIEPDEEAKLHRRGYCGLAGRPEEFIGGNK